MTGVPDERSELVHRDTAERVSTITLDSPHNRNALSRQLVAELVDHLQAADRSDEVRAIVLTHSGTTFCAGADLSEAISGGMELGTRSLLGLLRTVLELGTPVIALVHGHVRAGGVGLVGACDVAIVASRSSFAFTESRLGLAPAIISLTTSSRMGERQAAHKYLTGMSFDGNEAARCGLVTQAVADDDLDLALVSVVGELKSASPQGVRESKALLNRSLLRRFDDEGEALVATSARLFASADAQAAMAAFRERRPPPWSVTP